jgi:hypothetical protein
MPSIVDALSVCISFLLGGIWWKFIAALSVRKTGFYLARYRRTDVWLNMVTFT